MLSSVDFVWYLDGQPLWLLLPTSNLIPCTEGKQTILTSYSCELGPSLFTLAIHHIKPKGADVLETDGSLLQKHAQQASALRQNVTAGRWVDPHNKNSETNEKPKTQNTKTKQKRVTYSVSLIGTMTRVWEGRRKGIGDWVFYFFLAKIKNSLDYMPIECASLV